MKNSNDTIGNRTRDLTACSAVPQPTALPRAPIEKVQGSKPCTIWDSRPTPYSTATIYYHFKYINQLDVILSQVYYLTFMYSSTCFGRPHAHHRDLNNCSSSLWFYRWSVVAAVLLVVVGPAGPTTTNSMLSCT